MLRRTLTRTQLDTAIADLDLDVDPSAIYSRLLGYDDALRAGSRTAIAFDLESLADYGAFLSALQSLAACDAERVILATSVQVITSGGGYGAPPQQTAWWPGIVLVGELTREEQLYATPDDTEALTASLAVGS